MEEAVYAGVAGRTLVPTFPQAGRQWTDGQTDKAAAPRSARPLTGATRLCRQPAHLTGMNPEEEESGLESLLIFLKDGCQMGRQRTARILGIYA